MANQRRYSRRVRARVGPVSGSTCSAASVSGIVAETMSGGLAAAAGSVRGNTPGFVVADCKMTILPGPNRIYAIVSAYAPPNF